eukprot:CAMPEP_0113614058 /NCGR_PEP_ID=MMETSP0017_2-20120614/6965_1 /TAXON_ID=2856 /ORGANISM="Cylindrotheca closterium" /LENGTH=86 /DNA_ID=CAMNT_0000523203 /DNA_START=565 /DNA_END=822 /DNA_ORIENTATION=- /assembly_acc=CAM_ASM_000147
MAGREGCIPVVTNISFRCSEAHEEPTRGGDGSTQEHAVLRNVYGGDYVLGHQDGFTCRLEHGKELELHNGGRIGGSREGQENRREA